MRIIGGKYKGRQIMPDKNFKARPTTDFARENLFNILVNQYNLCEFTVLDLFSGTGSISYEFASRGCKKVIAIEKNFRHASFIKSTIEKINMPEVKIIKTDVFQYIKWCKDNFDIIFADPPFDLPKRFEIPGIAIGKGLLKPDGRFILEHSKNDDYSTHPNFWEVRKYGSVCFSFFRSLPSS